MKKRTPGERDLTAAFQSRRRQEKMVLLRKYLKLPCRDQVRFMEAALWLGIFRLAILIVPFKRIAGFLGNHMVETDETAPDSETRKELLAVSWAIRTMSRHLPWECKCLAQAAAAKLMLGHRGIPGTLYLGVAKDEEQKLIAHAWLRAGDIILTGRAGMERYTVISMFS